MRLTIDSLIAVMLVAILGGVVWAHRTEDRKSRVSQQLHHSLARLHEPTVFHGAVGDVELSETGFPKQIAPNWFEEELPMNVLASSRRPWIDVAPPGDMSDHPPDPVLNDPDQAGFWYNPNRGVFRARVTALITDESTLKRYNQINHSILTALPYAVEMARQPIAHQPLAATAFADQAAILHPRQLQKTKTTEHVEQDAADTAVAPARPSLRDR